MDRLPQVIYHEICSFIDEDDFPRPLLATISRPWQMAIEPLTFRHIRLESPHLSEFEQIVHHNRRRRRYIRDIKYLIELPAYCETARCRFEREEDRQRNNLAFTTALQDLFRLLASWEVEIDGSLSLTLLDAYSISDSLRASSRMSRPPTPLEEADSEDETTQDIYIGEWRHAYSRLKLVTPSLPTVEVISFFQIEGIMTRTISSTVALDIAAQLPNTEQVVLQLRDEDMRYPAFARSMRHEFAQRIGETLPKIPWTRSLLIITGQASAWSPSWGLSNRNFNSAPSDSLSETIRIAVQKLPILEHLVVSGVMDAGVLWPKINHNPQEPHWQNLEDVNIRFDIRRPSGGCYFHVEEVEQPLGFDPGSVEQFETAMPPGHGYSETEDITAARSFRVDLHQATDYVERCNMEPDEEAILPLLVGFAKMCLQIRTLQSAELTARIPVSFEKGGKTMWANYDWGVSYVSPGASVHWKFDYTVWMENKSQRRLFWAVKSWRPSLELRELFRRIGRERYGGSVVERFLDLKDIVP